MRIWSKSSRNCMRKSTGERIGRRPVASALHSEDGWPASAARHSDVAGIMHLMQFAFGMMDGDGPSWRPILGGVDPICHRS